MTQTEATPVLARYGVRFAASTKDLLSAQRLRHQCFVTEAGRAPLAGGLDTDRFDGLCRHVIVEDAGAVVATFRVMTLPDGRALRDSYSAQSYDLTALAAFPRPMVELGRFCISPDVTDPGEAAHILRTALGAITRIVERAGAGLLFGCSSFAGTDPQPYRAAFQYLAARHAAPAALAPLRKAPATIPLDTGCTPSPHALPPLLRSYLGLGGWVSDHAVVDAEMRTLHVFTAVETARVPPRRAEALRRLSEALPPEI